MARGKFGDSWSVVVVLREMPPNTRAGPRTLACHRQPVRCPVAWWHANNEPFVSKNLAQISHLLLNKCPAKIPSSRGQIRKCSIPQMQHFCPISIASSFANFEKSFVFADFSCHGAKPALYAGKPALSCRQKRKGGHQRAPGALFLATDCVVVYHAVSLRSAFTRTGQAVWRGVGWRGISTNGANFTKMSTVTPNLYFTCTG